MSDPGAHGGTPTSVPRRPRHVVAAEIAALRAHLLEMPPHHAAGTRDRLEAHLVHLEAELARSRD